MPSGTDRLLRRTVDGVAAGAAGGLVLGALETTVASLTGEPGALLAARIVLLDVLLGLAAGFLVGLVTSPVPPGRGPVALSRAFLARGPAGPRVRAAAVVVAAVAFLHGTMALGEAFATRFHNATLAAALLLVLQAALLLPAAALGVLTERLLAPRHEAWSAAAILLASATLGATAARSVAPSELWLLPPAAGVVAVVAVVATLVDSAGRPRSLTVALVWAIGLLACVVLWVLPPDVAGGETLRDRTLVAGRVAEAARPAGVSPR